MSRLVFNQEQSSQRQSRSPKMHFLVKLGIAKNSSHALWYSLGIIAVCILGIIFTVWKNQATEIELPPQNVVTNPDS